MTGNTDLEKRQAAKREDILVAATKLFFEEGYGRTTMDNVLAKIGGSKRTLYKHFPNKEALFKAIVAQVSDRVLSALTPQSEGKDFKVTLVDMGTRYLEVMTSPEGIALYRAMVAEAPHFPDLANTFLRNGPYRASKHLAEYLRTYAHDNDLDMANPELAAAQFMGAVRGDAHLQAVLNGQTPSKEDIQLIVTSASESFLSSWIY
jgi:AcrR family transcriptional regulator